jgi:hypothetical protein
VHRDGVPGAEEIPRHGPTHDARTDDADAHGVDAY